MAGVALLGSPRSFMAKSSNFSGLDRERKGNGSYLNHPTATPFPGTASSADNQMDSSPAKNQLSELRRNTLPCRLNENLIDAVVFRCVPAPLRRVGSPRRGPSLCFIHH